MSVAVSVKNSTVVVLGGVQVHLLELMLVPDGALKLHGKWLAWSAGWRAMQTPVRSTQERGWE